MAVRCMVKKLMSGKFRFRTGKGKSLSKCAPSMATSKRHEKLFGRSLSHRHKKHLRGVAERRVAGLVKARAARLENIRGRRYASYKSAGGKM